MAEKVRFKGIDSFDSKGYSADAKNLEIGKEYEVFCKVGTAEKRDSLYKLCEVEGYFPVEWFEEVTDNCKYYVAVGKHIPKIGEEYVCRRIETINGKYELSQYLVTSFVRKVEFIGGQVFKITTRTNVYIVSVQ